jgi:hypothetical protein
MKKVHVLVGSLAVAAPVLATMMPAPTLAAAHRADQPAKSKGKTVSVFGAARASAQAAATSSSSSVIGASPSTGNSKVPCEGVKKYHKYKNEQSLTFWSGPLGNPISYNCIGTVEGRWYSWPLNPDWVFRVKIYTDGEWATPFYNRKTKGYKQNSHTVYGVQGIHEWLTAPVRVCTAWYLSNSGVSTDTVCKTID